MMTKENHILEAVLAENSPSTASDFSLVSRDISFLNRLSGLYILDIGSGTSLAPSELGRLGAKAFAVDFRYKSLKELKRNIDRYLTNPAFYSNRPVLPLSNEERRAEREFIRWMRKNKEAFFARVSRDRSIYIAALAGSLPFRDETFDLCFSVNCLNALLTDFEVFVDCVDEAMRVLKKGGELQITPWYTGQGKWGKIRAEHAAQFIEHLARKEITYTIESVEPMLHKRLKIRK